MQSQVGVSGLGENFRTAVEAHRSASCGLRRDERLEGQSSQAAAVSIMSEMSCWQPFGPARPLARGTLGIVGVLGQRGWAYSSTVFVRSLVNGTFKLYRLLPND